MDVLLSPGESCALVGKSCVSKGLDCFCEDRFNPLPAFEEALACLKEGWI